MESFDIDGPAGIVAFLKRLFTSDFMPHGHCYFWRADILWLNVISDAVIALAYYSIPAVLVYVVRKRKDLPFHRVFWMFGAFILLCGTTHLVEIYTTWIGQYRFEGIVKLLTAVVSIGTAFMLFPLMPKLLAVPNLQNALASLENRSNELAKANEDLERFNKTALGRENRIIELKKEVNELSQRLGKEPPYDPKITDES